MQLDRAHWARPSPKVLPAGHLLGRAAASTVTALTRRHLVFTYRHAYSSLESYLHARMGELSTAGTRRDALSCTSINEMTGTSK